MTKTTKQTCAELNMELGKLHECVNAMVEEARKNEKERIDLMHKNLGLLRAMHAAYRKLEWGVNVDICTQNPLDAYNRLCAADEAKTILHNSLKVS